MKTVGLITEYNPFHNGHLYHIEMAQKTTHADTVIVIMSGDYVQRGTPAIMPKALRTEMALQCGASVVFELPVCYATGSAELFAMGAVSFLDALNVVDSICFGSECNDLEKLQVIADFLCEEPSEFKQALQERLKEGATFPAARHHALESCMNNPEYTDIIRDPNNILGIEYLKALKKLNSPMKAHTIQRQESHYHDLELRSKYSSASAIRSLLAYSGSVISTQPVEGTFDNTQYSNIFHTLEEQVPNHCLDILKDYHRVKYPLYQNDFSLLLKYKLLNKTPADLFRYVDVSEEMANRIYNQINNYFNYKQFRTLIQTKDVTTTRVNRALLHILLGTKKNNLHDYIEGGYHYYARLLGVRKDKERILSIISKNSRIPLLSKLSEEDSLPKLGSQMLYHDILASNLYSSVITYKFRTAFANEYKQPIIKL